jgi:putative hydrolase of the HAD superfamily
MARPPLGIIFDFDGVITRTRKRAQVLRRCEADLGLPVGRLMELLFSGPHWRDVSTGLISEEQYWSAVTQGLGDRIPTVLEPFRACCFAYEELNHAAVVWARKLKQHHKLALLSNATLCLDSYLNEMGIDELFDVVVSSASTGLRKPDVRIYELTLLRLGLGAADCVFIDDKDRNTAAAQSMGLRSITFRSVADARRRLAATIA